MRSGRAGPAGPAATGVQTVMHGLRTVPVGRVLEEVIGRVRGRKVHAGAVPHGQAAQHATKEPGPNGHADPVRKAARSDRMVIAR